MTVLSAQSIRRLCTPPVPAIADFLPPFSPLITPFVERAVVNGKSYGLSACTYDCRIADDLVLEPMPFALLARSIRNRTTAGNKNWENANREATRIESVRYRALASTMERFCLPANVCGSVLDKSSFARVFVSAFNTLLDPGWRGVLTVELVNLGNTIVTYKTGDPVCQIKFEWLDEPTDLPYAGKYQDQEAGPQAARYENDKPRHRRLPSIRASCRTPSLPIRQHNDAPKPC